MGRGRRKFIWVSIGAIALGLLAASRIAARADGFGCKGADRCVCSESKSPKNEVGFGTSEQIQITCVNMRDMTVAYFSITRAEAAAAHKGKAR